MTLPDLIAEKEKKLGDTFYVMLERAGRNDGESSEDWTEMLESFLSKSLREVAEATLEAVRVEEKRVVNKPHGDSNAVRRKKAYNAALAEITAKAKKFMGQ